MFHPWSVLFLYFVYLVFGKMKDKHINLLLMLLHQIVCAIFWQYTNVDTNKL